jgi:hypothetical protein
VRRITYRSFR